MNFRTAIATKELAAVFLRNVWISAVEGIPSPSQYLSFSTVIEKRNKNNINMYQAKEATLLHWNNLGLIAIYLLLVMGLGYTTLHWNATGIHSTTHPCLRCKVISSHTLRLHSLHVKHRPGHGSVHSYMSTWHASRYCISRRYLVQIIRWACTHPLEYKAWNARLPMFSILKHVIFYAVHS